MKHLWFILGFVSGLYLFFGCAHAELAVCFDNARPAGSQFYFHPSVDPSHVTDVNCHVIPKGSGTCTQDQKTLIQSTVDRGAPVGIRPATMYMKVASGPCDTFTGNRAELMTSGEMDAVDAAIVAAKAPYVVAQNEVNTNDICADNTLTEISDYWSGAGPTSRKSVLQESIATLDTAIATLAAGNPKTAMIASRDALVAQMNMFITHMEKLWRYTCSRTFLRP